MTEYRTRIQIYIRTYILSCRGELSENFMERKARFCSMRIGVNNYNGTDNETTAIEASN